MRRFLRLLVVMAVGLLIFLTRRGRRGNSNYSCRYLVFDWAPDFGASATGRVFSFLVDPRYSSVVYAGSGFSALGTALENAGELSTTREIADLRIRIERLEKERGQPSQ